MAWTNSKVFVSTIEDMLENTTAIDLNTSTFHAALYNSTTVPSQTVTSANTAYAVDQWVVGNELDDGTDWDTGGEPLTTVTFAPTSNVLKFDADNTPQGGTTCTITAAEGCLVYDFTVATPVDNQGISYHYFSGPQSVTLGTFTIVWNAANGLFQITL